MSAPPAQCPYRPPAPPGSFFPVASVITGVENHESPSNGTQREEAPHHVSEGERWRETSAETGETAVEPLGWSSDRGFPKEVFGKVDGGGRGQGGTARGSGGRMRGTAERTEQLESSVDANADQEVPLKLLKEDAIPRKKRKETVIAGVCLCVWFLLNILVTIYGKAIFSLYKFPYPILFTGIHMVFTSAGVYMLQLTGAFVPRYVSWDGFVKLVWFSLVFSANIWLSNASLMAVSIGLHQVVRTTIPLFTMALSLVAFKKRYPLKVLPSVILVIVGVAYTIRGDVGFTVGSFLIVVIGCFFSSLKGILTQRSQVGSMNLSALDLLRYLCPLATIELLVLALFMGELSEFFNAGSIDGGLRFHLPLMGMVAFSLNYVSFKSAALLSPLTLNIAGNVKQVLTSLMSFYIFGGVLTIHFIVGIFATAVGALWYSFEMQFWIQKSVQEGATAAATKVSKDRGEHLDIHSSPPPPSLVSCDKAQGSPSELPSLPSSYSSSFSVARPRPSSPQSSALRPMPSTASRGSSPASSADGATLVPSVGDVPPHAQHSAPTPFKVSPVPPAPLAHSVRALPAEMNPAPLVSWRQAAPSLPPQQPAPFQWAANPHNPECRQVSVAPSSLADGGSTQITTPWMSHLPRRSPSGGTDYYPMCEMNGRLSSTSSMENRYVL